MGDGRCWPLPPEPVETVQGPGAAHRVRTVVVRKALWFVSAFNVAMSVLLLLENRLSTAVLLLVGGVAGLLYLELTNEGVRNGRDR